MTAQPSPRAPEPELEPVLDQALARLELALGASRGSGGVEGRGAAELGAPERELLVALDGGAGPAGSLSFGLGPDEGEGLGARTLDALLDRVLAAAQVETEGRAGQVVARTRVGLGGDLHSSLRAPLDPALLRRHFATVEAELTRHRERVLLLVAVIQVAAKIALAAGTGNPLLAVPAALEFIRGIMAEGRA